MADSAQERIAKLFRIKEEIGKLDSTLRSLNSARIIGNQMIVINEVLKNIMGQIDTAIHLDAVGGLSPQTYQAIVQAAQVLSEAIQSFDSATTLISRDMQMFSHEYMLKMTKLAATLSQI